MSKPFSIYSQRAEATVRRMFFKMFTGNVFKSLLSKVADLKPCKFIKRILVQHRCFPVNIANFLRTASIYRTFYQGGCFCQSNTARFSQPTVTLVDLHLL